MADQRKKYTGKKQTRDTKKSIEKSKYTKNDKQVNGAFKNDIKSDSKSDLKKTVNSKVSLKPSTMLAPVPAVLVSCKGKPDGQRPQPNMLTIAWAGTVCSDPAMLSISVRKSRWSYEQIKETREFVVNLVSKDLLWAADYCGVKSGADTDKFKDCKLTPIPAEGLHLAPAIEQSPLTISCRLSQIIELGTHDLLIGKIVAVEVDPKIMKGQKLCLDKADLIAYSHGEYYELGSVLGFFGYSVASADVIRRRMPASKAEDIRKSRPTKKGRPGNNKNSKPGKKKG